MMTFETQNIPSLTAAKEQKTYKEVYCQASKITESNSVNGQANSPDITVMCSYKRQFNPGLISTPNNWNKALDNCLAFLAGFQTVPRKVFIIHTVLPLSV